MNMIEAIRVAQVILLNHHKQVLIRPKHYALHRWTARTWFMIEQNERKHVLLEVFWHPEDHLLKVKNADMPNIDAMLLDWELRNFSFQSNEIVSTDFMQKMKNAFLHGHALPSLSTSVLQRA